MGFTRNAFLMMTAMISTVLIVHAEDAADTATAAANSSAPPVAEASASLVVDTSTAAVDSSNIDTDLSALAADTLSARRAAAASAQAAAAAAAASAARAAATTADTSTKKITGAFIGIGAGLSIGSIPLFTMWQSSLPADMNRLGIPYGFGSDLSPGDTGPLRYRVTEAPEVFNVVMPFRVSAHSVKSDRTMSFALSFFNNGKQFQSTLYIDPDTAGRRVNLHEKLTYTSLSLEATYQWAIPPVFFSVDKTQQTYFSLSAGFSPLNHFTRDGGIKNSAPDDDARMRAVADSVQKRFSYLSSNGMSLSWSVGINTLKSYTMGTGLELGLFYNGSLNSRFYNDGMAITKKQIYDDGSGSDNPLSFISTRIEFKVSFLIPTERRDNNE